MALPTTSSGKNTGDRTGNFGEIAIRLGYVTRAQLDEAIKVQSASAKAGLRKRVGEILVKKGYLSPEQFEKVLKSQTVTRKRVGDYELLSKLGEGGMGSVFKAKQLSMDRVVALKVLSPKMAKNSEFRDRFLREARAVAKFNHPHIVSGIDVGSADGYWYFAMEYVDGDSLGQYMQRMGGKLPEDKALEFVRQTALALQHAHENSVLHRDVKPDNILLDKNARTAKLVDLGLARATEAEHEDSTLTQAGMAVGTPFYISPEQARGRSDLTPATDLYSLGATLFHLLTGQVPFDGPTAAAIMTRHVTDPVPNPRAVNPDISAGAERIVVRLMQKDPHDRYKDANQLAQDIERLLKGGVPEKPASAGSSRIPGKGGKAAKGAVAKEHDDDAPAMPERRLSRTRPFRRRKRQTEIVEVGVAAVLMIVLILVLLVLQPWKDSSSGKPSSKKTPERAPEPTKQTQAPAPSPSYPPQPAAVPATLTPQADGHRGFRANFEGRLDNFDVDPNLYKGAPLAITADAAGTNHVLRLAPVRNPYRSTVMQKESAVMARLLLPADLMLSPRTLLTAKVYIGQADESNPELRVYWEHKTDTGSRHLAAWDFNDPSFRAGWGRVQVQLGKGSKFPSREAAGSLQYITFMAGAPEKKIEVYLDDIEITEGGPELTGEHPAPAPKTPEKEAPVAPAPPAKTPEREAPVAPPPKNDSPLDRGMDALKGAI